MTNEENSSSALLTRQQDPDDSMLDADELEEDVPVNKGRGMSLDYSKIETLLDYPSAQKYMSEKMIEYKFRYRKDTQAGRKEYYYCKGFKRCSILSI